ncbi:ATP-binding cassette domain-containing protein [Ramlibacter tataouinensis]|uniref:ABC transporter ATP-binding protein n=1 Tax=Ramlibacter tataouinensis TaxID=94132 RepID=UPI0022F40197|nr:ATP-binding cassette domain-containing protein [Ramlibacter tataouinensis]WBY03151.1 ATP-binding cassette domain-containing protein [Ramlibacter tataouinensis]
MLDLLALARLHVGPVGLRIQAGECIGIQGRSGSGKSILLRMIADLDPHAGDCALDGAHCSAMPAPAWRRQVTYVAADSGWWSADVAAHFPAPAQTRPLLGRVGLPDDALDWPVARLSTGESQRLALLRAITPDNRVLLLDEPTSGLDPESRDGIESLLREQLAAGTGIVLVTHDPGLAARLGHRRFAMDDGRLREVPP